MKKETIRTEIVGPVQYDWNRECTTLDNESLDDVFEKYRSYKVRVVIETVEDDD